MDVEGSNRPRVESKDDCWWGRIGLIVRWKERKEKKRRSKIIITLAFSIMQNTSNTQWQVFLLVNQVWLAREANFYEPLHFACCNASAPKWLMLIGAIVLCEAWPNAQCGIKMTALTWGGTECLVVEFQEFRVWGTLLGVKPKTPYKSYPGCQDVEPHA
jgi:hypothetical protein